MTIQKLLSREWLEDVRLDRGSGWLDGLRAFYLGFLTGLLVVPLYVQLGCIFWELRRSRLGGNCVDHSWAWRGL